MAEFDDLTKAEQEAAEAIKVDGSLYQFLTDEILEGYLPIIFNIGQLEGDFIGQFNRKANDKGITVNDDYIKHLWETKRQVPGVDLRSGEYGIDYAGAGFLHAGCQFYARGDLGSALTNFAKAIELCPRNILARSLKAQIHTVQSNFLLAATEASNSIVLNPVYIAERDSGSRAVLEKQTPALTKVFKDFLVHAYHIRGLAFYNLVLFDAAIADFDEVVRREPAQLAAVDARVGAFMNTGRWKEALEDCDTLLAAGFEKEKNYQYRGFVLKELERYAEAIDDFTAAIAINPGLSYAYLQRSDCNFEEGFYEDALNDADIAVENEIPDAHYLRARAYFECGEFTKSIADFDITIGEHPDNEIIKEMRERSVDYKNRGITMCYHRKNEQGEWEQVEKSDGKIIQVIPTPDYQDFLDVYRREEAEKRRKAAK